MKIAAGVFIWNLMERKGELIVASFDRVKYSPDSKYIALYKINSRHRIQIEYITIDRNIM